MQYLLEHFAVAVCGIPGVLAGKGKRLDLFGVEKTLARRMTALLEAASAGLPRAGRPGGRPAGKRGKTFLKGIGFSSLPALDSGVQCAAFS